jgi:hypothetical protein
MLSQKLFRILKLVSITIFIFAVCLTAAPQGDDFFEALQETDQGSGIDDRDEFIQVKV